jgi:hypothetical protein
VTGFSTDKKDSRDPGPLYQKPRLKWNSKPFRADFSLVSKHLYFGVMCCSCNKSLYFGQQAAGERDGWNINKRAMASKDCRSKHKTEKKSDSLYCEKINRNH